MTRTCNVCDIDISHLNMNARMCSQKCRDKKRRSKDSEKIRERNRKYEESNKDKKLHWSKESYQRRKAKVREYTLRTKERVRLRRYGLSPEEYEVILAKHAGCCHICKRHYTDIESTLHIDHCHKTGKVRGLLCSNCNTGIGLLKDDVNMLACAIEYLKEYENE